MTTESNTAITEGKCEYINAYYVNVAGGDLYRNGSVEFSGVFVDDNGETVKRITLYTTQEAASEAAKAMIRDMIDDLAYNLKDEDIEDVLDNGLYGRGIEELHVYDTGEVWVKVPIAEVQDCSAEGDFEVENIGEDGSFDLLVNTLDGVSFDDLKVLDALIASKKTLEELDEIIRKAEQIIREDKKAAPTEDKWQGEGWYTFRTWVKTDGKFTVEDWESPVKPDPVFIENKDEFMEACQVPYGCECIVERLNSDYELRSETYNSVKKDWTPEGNYDDVPCEYLKVTITFKDEDGDEETDSEVMEIPEGWDCTESEDYEWLAKILCERNGCFFDENNWKD